MWKWTLLVRRIGYKEDSHYVDPSLIKEGYDKTTLGQVSLTKLVQPISMRGSKCLKINKKKIVDLDRDS